MTVPMADAQEPGGLEGKLPAAWRPLLSEPAIAELLGQPLVDDALLELWRRLPATLAVHSLRTYLLADAYARTQGVGYDRPGLLAAAAFHDTGLADGGPRRPCPFPRQSAELLDRFLSDHAVDTGRRAVLTRAVSDHMRARPARDAGAEARLLHFGAWLDVTGRGTRRLPGMRRRLARLAPTPWLAVSFSTRLTSREVRRGLRI
jgi:hypothetical protein